MLTTEGPVSAQNSKWDLEKLCATSNIDLELDVIISESQTFGWLPDLENNLIHFDTSNIKLQTDLYQKATDADSISTFAKNCTQNINKTPNICLMHG